MKIYSEEAITRDQVAASVNEVKGTISSLDIKQTAQIRQLRLWLAASFAVNVVLTLVLRFI